MSICYFFSEDDRWGGAGFIPRPSTMSWRSTHAPDTPQIELIDLLASILARLLALEMHDKTK